MQKPLTATQIADDMTSVPLSNRREYGDYITYTALSSDGHTEYTVTLNSAGRATGCTCPATVKNCRHARAAEFEFAWTAPVASESAVEVASVASTILGEQFAQDLPAHVEDSIESGEFVNPFAGMTKAQRREAYRAMYPDDFYFAA